MQNFNNGEEIVNCSNRDYILKLSQNMVLKLAYEELKHPRDAHGRWTFLKNSVNHLWEHRGKYVSAALITAASIALHKTNKWAKLTSFKHNIRNLKSEVAAKNLRRHLIKNTKNVIRNHNKAKALKKYTSDMGHLKSLQNKLRNRQKLNFSEATTYRHLTKAINNAGKLPSTIITHRGIYLEPVKAQELLSKFKSKKYVRFRGLISSAISRKHAEWFANPELDTGAFKGVGEGIIFNIKTNKGLWAGNIIGEIINKHGSKYKILNVKKKVGNMKYHEVELEQI